MGAQFVSDICTTYNEIVHWRKNLFILPTGKAAKLFISELTTWLSHYNQDTEFHGIALKVFMVLPALLLQKPSKASKAKEHLSKLDERLKLWKQGSIITLLHEGQKIQKRLQSSNKRKPEDTARVFAKLMMQGKINAALKFLSKESENGVLDLNDDVLRDLKKKHPEPSPIKENSLLNGPIENIPASYFDTIDESMVQSAARLTKGAGGPSQMDDQQYRKILLSTKYKKEGGDLREEIASLAKKLASSFVDPKSIEALISCRLIPLNKSLASAQLA